MIPTKRRERYLRDPLPMRLGNLASDLTRIASCAEDPDSHHIVLGVLEESRYFAEWAGTDAPYETQVVLADTQQVVIQWASSWKRGVVDPAMSTEARRRAEELLKLAGLIE